MTVQGIGSGSPSPLQPKQPDKLREVAREFESVFLQMMLKQMRSATQSLSGQPVSFQRETYEGWQDEQFAKSMSAGKGIGIAEVLYRQLQQQAMAKEQTKG